MGTLGKNNQVTPCFCNIAVFECPIPWYMADICAKFEKIWIVHHFEGTYLNLCLAFT